VATATVPFQATPVDIATLSLPAGDYLISASGRGSNGSNDFAVVCSFWKNNTKFFETFNFMFNGDVFGTPIDMTEVVGGGAPFSVHLACYANTDGDSLANVRLIASQVGAIVTQ
jgi:hypothetical protein